MSTSTGRHRDEGFLQFRNIAILAGIMRILFVHQNFPGQYVHLAPALAQAGHEVRALMLEPTARPLPGVTCTRYRVTA